MTFPQIGNFTEVKIVGRLRVPVFGIIFGNYGSMQNCAKKMWIFYTILPSKIRTALKFTKSVQAVQYVLLAMTCLGREHKILSEL